MVVTRGTAWAVSYGVPGVPAIPAGRVGLQQGFCSVAPRPPGGFASKVLSNCIPALSETLLKPPRRTVASFSPKIFLRNPFRGRGEYATDIRGETSDFLKLYQPGPLLAEPPRTNDTGGVES